jgi:hypothetical protein
VAKLRTELAGGAPTSTLDRLKALSASAAQA